MAIAAKAMGKPFYGELYLVAFRARLPYASEAEFLTCLALPSCL